MRSPVCDKRGRLWQNPPVSVRREDARRMLQDGNRGESRGERWESRGERWDHGKNLCLHLFLTISPTCPRAVRLPCAGGGVCEISGRRTSLPWLCRSSIPLLVPCHGSCQSADTLPLIPLCSCCTAYATQPCCPCHTASAIAVVSAPTVYPYSLPLSPLPPSSPPRARQRPGRL